ncbi:MAG: phosphatase PAP2 family protein [Chloroflexi bacterium]|jgi:hypothetical protein|nr:phosphatase PAP2 family protein [Chloroflexota bacterium]
MNNLQPLWSAITFLGEEAFYLLIMPLVYWCVDALAGFRIGVMLLLSAGTNGFFKLIFKSPRPYWVSDKIIPGAYNGSFGLPSGHAQNAAAVWGWTAREIKRPWAKWLMGILVFLIGFSRICLGVHFISDVLLGWIIGAFLVWIFARNLESLRDNLFRTSLSTKLILALLTSLLVLTLPLLVAMLSRGWQIPAEWIALGGDIDPMNMDGSITISGLWLGMMGGFSILLHKKGILSSSLGGGQKVLRYLVGMGGLLALYAGLGAIFPRDLGLFSMLLRFVRYLLIGLWVTWLSPLLFQQLRIGEIKPFLPSQTTARR